MMVITMHDIYKFLRPFAISYPMKCKAVHQVFKKSPEKHTSKKSQGHPDNCKIKPFMAQIQKINHYRHVQSPDYQRMRFGQHFQVLVPKQLGLTFIMYFFEFHLTSELMVKN